MTGTEDRRGQHGDQDQPSKRVQQNVDHQARAGPTGRFPGPPGLTLNTRHGLKPTDGAYIYTKEVYVQFLLLVIILAGLAYVAWRVMRAANNRPRRRVIGPDDDPDFLNRLNHGEDPR